MPGFLDVLLAARKELQARMLVLDRHSCKKSVHYVKEKGRKKMEIGYEPLNAEQQK